MSDFFDIKINARRVNENKIKIKEPTSFLFLTSSMKSKKYPKIITGSISLLIKKFTVETIKEYEKGGSDTPKFLYNRKVPKI